MKSTSHLQDDAQLPGVITLITEMYTILQILSSGINIWLNLLLKNDSQAQTQKNNFPLLPTLQVLIGSEDIKNFSQTYKDQCNATLKCT